MKKDDLACKNIHKPIKEVRHADLERADDNSIYKSECPTCGKGLLLVARNAVTMVLKEYDMCILCGQQYRYLDIEEMRNREHQGLKEKPNASH